MTANVNLWKRPSIDYTSRDFEAIRDDMIRTIPFFTEEWTDYNPSDFGIVLLELLAFMGDNLHYYIDRMASESFLPTALTRRSVVNLLKLIDYELRGKVAATVDVRFTIAEPLTAELVIPEKTLLKTLCDRPGSQTDAFANNIYFETASELTVPTGALLGTVGAVQGRTSTDVILGTSDGLPNQKFEVPETPVIDDSLRVFVDEGIGLEEWEIVETMIENLSCDKVCMTFQDDQLRTFVQFGDNGQGKIPDAGAPIYGTYRIGGGAEGNVGADTITIIEDSITFAGSPITITVTNIDAATGGEDEQSIESARLEGPRTLRALYRAVTVEDFEGLAEVFAGVAKAKAVAGHFWGTNQSSCCQVSLYIVPVGGGLPSIVLKRDLIEYFDSRKLACTCVEIFDPLYQPVDVRGVIVTFSNFNVEDVEQSVLARIDAYFDESESPYTGFDKGAYLSDIIYVIDGTDGVDHVDLTDFTRHPFSRFAQWAGEFGNEGSTPDPVGDGATFDDDEWEIGENSVDEEWTLTMTSPTDFTVVGTVSGSQGTGQLGTEFNAANGNVTLLLEAGTEANQPGDFVKFKTSPKLANVNLEAGEFFTEGTVELVFSIGGPGPRVRCVD